MRLKKNKGRVAVFLISLMVVHTATPLLAAEVVLRAGTTIQLELIETVSSKTHAIGQPVKFRVVNDVTVGRKIVISRGSFADGKVASVDKSGILGKPGSIGIQLTSVTAVDGTTVPVTATRVVDGESKQTLSIVLTLLCLFPLLIKGGNATFQAGSAIEATTLGAATINVE